ncbi:MAG TPA: DUF6265 family protein [Casimicrobiaceae bacterium]|nr:DUF6265 family protein [Casimicrobiaceae bacterium]
MPLARFAFVLLFAAADVAIAQPAPATESPATPAAPAAPGVPDIQSMKWLEGCWQGSVNNRTFREVWLPLRGAMMVGVSQTVMGDKTLDYEYLRIEPRGEGTFYVVSPPGKPERAFKLTDELVDKEDDAHTFVFVDPAGEFPRRIGYRRATQGWLYTEVEGKVGGADRKVIYPMRRIDCETGEIVAK